MARRRPSHATLYDFRDVDLMHHLRHANGDALTTLDLADALGFDAEEGGRPVGIRLAWMRRYGMVALDETHRTWTLSRGGKRVLEARELAPALALIDELPDEAMVEAMAHVTSRYRRGDSMVAHMLRREFLFGTKRR